MTKETAEKLARKFLSENIALTVHTERPPGVFSFGIDPENEILISFSLFEGPMLGGDKFVSVSKVDGTVQFVPYLGD